jgi:hypothetical protein
MGRHRKQKTDKEHMKRLNKTRKWPRFERKNSTNKAHMHVNLLLGGTLGGWSFLHGGSLLCRRGSFGSCRLLSSRLLGSSSSCFLCSGLLSGSFSFDSSCNLLFLSSGWFSLGEGGGDECLKLCVTRSRSCSFFLSLPWLPWQSQALSW